MTKVYGYDFNFRVSSSVMLLNQGGIAKFTPKQKLNQYFL